MKRSNKILFSLSGLSLFAVPMFLASCGPSHSSARYDQVYDGKLKIATGFSENNVQGIGLKTIVSEFNKWLKSGSAEEQAKKTEKGYLPVEIVFTPNGYSTNALETKLSAKETKEFWNIMINYPTAASILAKLDMNLALPNDVYENLNIAEAFKHVNDEIGGNLESKEKWVVPFSRSSEMQSVNKVLLGKLLKELKEAGVKMGEDASTTKVKEYIDYYGKTSQSDAKYVDTEWAKSKATDMEAAKKSILELNLTLDDSIFQEYDKLINFAIAAKKLYPSDLNKPILGIDSLASAVNVMNVAITKGNASAQYINPSSGHDLTGGYDYESFKQNGTFQNELFKKITKTIFDGIKSGAVWIGGGGSFGSSLLTKHNMAISIGSTAGYSHTYISGDTETINYIKDQKNKVEKLYELVNKGDKDGNDVVLKFKSGKHINNIYANKLSQGTTVGQYDKQLVSDEVGIKLADEFKKNNKYRLLAGSVENNNLVLSSTLKIALSAEEIKKVVPLGTTFVNDGSSYVLVDNTLISQLVLSADKLLNFKDADWISTPLVKDASKDKKSVFIQGPSLVLIHANEKEDKATQLFVQWLFNTKLTSISFTNKGKPTEYKDVKPIEAFNYFSSYISPTADYINQDVNKIKGLNRASKIAFENFKKIQTNSNEYQPAEDVYSTSSDKLRESIGSAGRAIVNKVLNKKPVKFEDFINEILKLFA
ncbi:P68 family surface lipoprotein [Mycoplasma sp. 125]|uniref:P68 family surface lipoprotein n=1 Tax=Mycoplasma sp. 125 TaxID=3447505 RepID=UPI003F65A11E